MSATLEIPKAFDSRQVPDWIANWGPVCDAPGLQLRLPAGAFLCPAGIVVLAAGIAGRRARGLETSLTAEDRSSDAYGYLRRIDFFSELGVQSQPDGRRRDPSGHFVPLRRITSQKIARELANETSDVIEARLPDVGPSPIRMARFVFEELGANIVQHSGAPETGFGMAQTYPEARRIEIAFADSGVGFLASLQRNHELAGRIEGHAEALQLAIGRSVSSRESGVGNMGMGLALLVNFADVAAGDLRIASGDALLHRRTSVGSEHMTVTHSISPWSGSWICLEIELP